MVRFVHVILGATAPGAVVYGFHLPSGSLATCDSYVQVQRNRISPTLLKTRTFAPKNEHIISLSKADNNEGLAEEIDTLDTGLALEIETALSLAQDALAAEVPTEKDEEEEIDEIADMLLEKPPSAPSTLPAPPKEEPPVSIVSSSLVEANEVEDAETLSPESTSPPTVDLGEALQKKMGEEIEKLKNMIFGLNKELDETEADTKEAEDTAATLKKEIEESLQQREEMVKRIESEFASEKELLVEQMGVASDELKVVMDQSAQDVTDAKSKATSAEKELISRINSFKAAIDEVTAEAAKIKSGKDSIEQSKQSMLDNVIQEGKKRLERFTQSFDFDISYAKQVNEQLQKRAEEAEGKIRGIYDQINQMRTERVTLQQQIADVEKNALEEIETLQQQMEQDDERYATALENERERLDKVIDAAYQAYAIKVCKKIVERKAVEDDYTEKLRLLTLQIADKREKQEGRVKEYLDKLEEKHKKERITIYQEKFEAVDAVRKQMNEELAIEYEKIEEIHKEMRPKIDDVREQAAQMKVEFEKEMAKKKQLAKEEEDELLRQIEDVKVDMTDKMKTQRRLYDEQKAAYLEGMNAKISKSEEELRQKWKELAGVKMTYNAVSGQRDSMIDEVAEKQALIDSYESDQKSFRQSLRLTAKIAREKIGSKTRRLLKREK